MKSPKLDSLHPNAFTNKEVKMYFPFAFDTYSTLLPPLPNEKIVMENEKFTATDWRTYEYKGMKFNLGPSVHLPGISSAMIFDYLNKTDLANKDVLIMGVGAGVEPVIAASKNARTVYAVDVNKSSIETTKQNYTALVKNTATKLYTSVSDLFADVAIIEPVDLITFNSPHTYVRLSDREEINTNLSVGTTVSTRFFAEINQKNILKATGEIIFHLSNTSEMKKIMSYALYEGFTPELLRTVAYVNENDNISRHIFRFTYYEKEKK